MYFIYNLFGKLVIILSPIIFFFRIISGKEDLKRFKEKYCIYSFKNKKSYTVWLHATSVGEVMSIIPILKELDNNNKIGQVLLTTSTTSSANIFLKYKFKKTIHRYFPLDTNYFTKKFIKYWKPQIAIFVESEIWPNMFKNLHSNKIPIILLNARITKKSFKKWQIFSKFAKNVFSKIDLAMPQNSETQRYLKLLGATKIKIAGNLKYYGKKKVEKNSIVFKNKFRNHKILCAASTHNNEEALIGNLHKSLRKQKKNLLTIIIPRHIKRIKSIARELGKLGLKTTIHSSNNKISKSTDVYLVDSFGEASKFYQLSNITFMGGSIVQHGGQNPLEPARQKNYVLHGPNVHNFREVYDFLNKLNICSKAKSIKKLREKVLKNLDYKMPKRINNKIFLTGKKILSKNLLLINKYIK